MRKQKTPATVTCPNCEGCGEIENPLWRGQKMRLERNNIEATLTDVARKMGFSKGYVSDLELGRRAWSSKLISAYEKALR